MNYAIVRMVWAAGVATVIVALLASATTQAQGNNSPRGAVLHATVTITGGVTFTGSYDERLAVATCADVTKGGTNRPGSAGGPVFYVPVPPQSPGGNPGLVGGGHNFSIDAAAAPYHGPGTYTGSSLSATQLDADTRPDDQETHIFAFPTSVGTLIVNPDGSGSFQFSGLQDAGSVTISGQVTWTCS